MKRIRQISQILIGLSVIVVCSGCITEYDAGFTWTASITKPDLVTELSLIQSESMGALKWIYVWIAN